MLVIVIAACAAAFLLCVLWVVLVVRARRRRHEESRPHPTVTPPAARPSGIHPTESTSTHTIAAFIEELHAAEASRNPPPDAGADTGDDADSSVPSS